MLRIVSLVSVVISFLASAFFIAAMLIPTFLARMFPPVAISLLFFGASLYAASRTKPIGVPTPEAKAAAKKAKQELKKKLWYDHTWATLALIFTVTVVYFALQIKGVLNADPSSEMLIEAGAAYGRLTLHGQPWRLVTSIFVHASFMHLISNMVGLLFGARLLDYFIGWRNYLSVYVLSGLIGGLAQIIVNPDAVVGGASGAVFGVYGAMAACYAFSSRVRSKEVPRSVFILCGIQAMNSLVTGFSSPNTANAAHLFGLIGGFSLMSIWYLEKNSVAHRVKTFAGAGLVLVLSTVLVLPAMISGTPRVVVIQPAEKSIIESVKAIANLDREYQAKSQDPRASVMSAWLTGNFLARYRLAQSVLEKTSDEGVRPKFLVVKKAVMQSARDCMTFYEAIPIAVRSPAHNSSSLQDSKTTCIASSREAAKAMKSPQ